MNNYSFWIFHALVFLIIWPSEAQIQPVFPENGGRYAPNEVVGFRWNSDLDSTFQYRFQLAKDAEFNDLLLDSTITGYFGRFDDRYGNISSIEIRNDGSIDLPSLIEENGTYHWQVLATNADTTHRTSSDSFEIEESARSRIFHNTSCSVDPYYPWDDRCFFTQVLATGVGGLRCSGSK